MSARFALVNFGDSPEKYSQESSKALAFARGYGLGVEGVTPREVNEFARANPDVILALIPAETSLTRHSLVQISQAFDDNHNIAAMYGDDGKVELPDLSPQRLLNQNYVRVPIFIKGKVLSHIGGLSGTLSFTAALYALMLDLAFSRFQVRHLDLRLSSSHRRGHFLELSELEVSECREVLESAWARRAGGDVEEYLGQGAFRARGHVSGSPLVSIVIPTQAIERQTAKGPKSLVVDAVSSIVELTEYTHYEIVVVVDQVADENVLRRLEEIAGDRLRVIRWTKPFNFSQKMNFGVMHALGEYVLLLNDDVQVLSSRWLTSMLVLAQLDNAGMVGAMLYYEDDTIQHAGHAYFRGSPTHIGLGLPYGSPGPLAGNLVQREVSGVTAACALMPLAVFKAVGGFTDLLPGNFNDVDLCLKVGWKGFDIYWTPDAELYHFESKTRDAHVHYYELDVIEHRWGLRLDDSRYWRGHPWAAK